MFILGSAYGWAASGLVEAATNPSEPFLLPLAMGALILGFFLVVVPLGLTSLRSSIVAAVAIVGVGVGVPALELGGEPDPGTEAVPKISGLTIAQAEKRADRRYLGITPVDDRGGLGDESFSLDERARVCGQRPKPRSRLSAGERIKAVLCPADARKFRREAAREKRRLGEYDDVDEPSAGDVELRRQLCAEDGAYKYGGIDKNLSEERLGTTCP